MAKKKATKKVDVVEDDDATHTHYPAPEAEDEVVHRHILTMIAKDRAGTLSRIMNLFSARNYNIDGLAASNIDAAREISCITLSTRGTDKVIKQLCKQLERVVNVYHVSNVTGTKDRVIRELALIKVRAEGEKRLEALSIANSFRANIVDASKDTIIIEMVAPPEKLSTFIDVLRPLGVVDIVRSGVTGMINSSFSPLEDIMKEEDRNNRNGD